MHDGPRSQGTSWPPVDQRGTGVANRPAGDTLCQRELCKVNLQESTMDRK